jgi:DNA-binding NarL/FixJ family response regulator
MKSAESNLIRIMVVDDHPLLREGIARLVAHQGDMEIVAEASNGREAIQQFRKYRPDITIMDLQMPEMNGLDAIIAIRGEFHDARFMVLTTYTGDIQVVRAIKAGARAYLLKNSLHKELLETIRAVHSGKKVLSAEASFELAEHAAEDPLTPTEIRILGLIAGGNANKEIAARLSLSEETVKRQVSSILSKLGAHDRTHATMIALRRGLIGL